MNELTVMQIFELCYQQIQAGNGNKLVAISDDEEGNGYHPVYFGFTPKEQVFTGGDLDPLLSGFKMSSDFIILG